MPTSHPFDFSTCFSTTLPPAATRWSGFPPYNFVGGHNDPDSVPVADLTAAAARVIAREGRSLATYGLDSGPQGYRPLREFVAGRLRAQAGIDCSADQVLITSGSLQGLDLVNRLLVNPGDTVIVEQATYGGALTRLRACGAHIVGIPVDAGGLRTDVLETQLRLLEARRQRPKFIYTIPTVQNPTATVMDATRRAELLALAQTYGVPVFEDECYADLTWSGERPAAMRGMPGGEQVIHIGSFSKSVAPALRLGYLVADWPVMSRLLAIKNDGGSGALEQMVLAEYCQAHFDAHLPLLRAALRRKLDCLEAAVREQFGTDAVFSPAAGGIFLWVRLPETVDTSRLAQEAQQAGVAINPGAEWTADGDSGRHSLRLCFAHPDEATLRAGVARLAQVCRTTFGLPPPAHR